MPLAREVLQVPHGTFQEAGECFETCSDIPVTENKTKHGHHPGTTNLHQKSRVIFRLGHGVRGFPSAGVQSVNSYLTFD